MDIKKFIYKITVIFILIIFTVELYSNGDVRFDREMNWINLKNFDNSLYSKNEYKNIRQEIIDYLTDEWNNETSGELPFTTRIIYNNNFEGLLEEQKYYFIDNTSDFFTNISDFDSTNEDYLCIGNIDADANFRYNLIIHQLYYNPIQFKFYASVDVEAKILIELNNKSDGDLYKLIDKDKYDQRRTGYNYGVNVGGYWLNISQDYIQDNEEPVIQRALFADNPSRYFKIDYYDDTEVDKGAFGVPSGYDETEWQNQRYKFNYYRARSPRPWILGEKIFEKFSDPSEDNIKHNNNIYNTDIRTDFFVKLIYARFYKYNNDNGAWEYDKNDNPDIYKLMSQYENGIDYITISKKINDIDTNIKQRFDKNGKYMMALSGIDKFNKIYVFEPEFFIIDRETPEISNAVVNQQNLYNNPENPTIINLSGAQIEETYTDFTKVNIDDYIYIKYKNKKNPIKLSESENLLYEENQIKIKLQNELIDIEEIYLQDKAGNKSQAIVENREYVWDNTPPEIIISEQNADYLNTKQNLYLEIKESVGVDIKDINLTAKLDDITSYKYYYYESKENDILIVDLSAFENKEGILQLNIELKDKAGNETSPESQQILLNFDDKKPELTAALDDINLYNYFLKTINGDTKLSLNADDLNFKNIVLDFESNIYEREDAVIDEKNTEFIIKNIEWENKLGLNIIVNDLAGNQLVIKNIKLSCIDDHESPVISAHSYENNKWRYSINVYDELSFIRKVYIKEIEKENPDMDDFGDLPPDGTGWDVIGENIKNFSRDIDTLPGTSICILAEDGWGNITEEGIIIQNNNEEFTEINNKNDLINKSWDLSGDVVINEDIIIESDETLNITTNGIIPTNIRFNADNEKLKIINNGGTININADNDNITFSSLSDNNEEYSWFGIVNKSGDLSFSGTQKIYFKNAVSPIVYHLPENDIALENIEFENCKMGIHFIDNGNSYNNLEIDNIVFEKTVYGVKFDLKSKLEKDEYLKNYPYLIENNILDNGIKRSHIYYSIYGFVDFTNFNNAPECTSVTIEGTPMTGNELTIVYDYYDQNGDDINLNETKYKWFISNNKQGPYSIIMNENNFNWIVESGTAGKWISAMVIVEDIKGGSSRAYYSPPVKIGNNPPSAVNLSISIDPVRPDGKINIDDMLIANFTFNDIDGQDTEGIHIYNWYWTDIEGNYNETGYLIDTANERYFIPGETYAGKWLYFSVIPVDENGSHGNLEYCNTGVRIEDLDIPKIVGTPEIINDNTENNKLEGIYTTDPIDCNKDKFIYKWYKSINKNIDLQLIGGFIENEIEITADLEGQWIYFEVTPVNEADVVGRGVLSEPVYIEYSLPIAINLNIICTDIDGHEIDANGKPFLPIDGNILHGEYTYDSSNDIQEYGTAFQWYQLEDNIFIPIEGAADQEFEITSEYLEKTLRFEVTPSYLVIKDGENIPIVGESVSIDYKTCKLVTSKHTFNYYYDIQNNNGTFYFNLSDEIAINDNELIKKAEATVKVQGAGGGGGGGCQSNSFGFDLWYYMAVTFYRHVVGPGGGGGGAGGYTQTIDIVDPKKTYTITVGNGGTGGKKGDPGNKGNDGNPSSSSLGNINAEGGIGGKEGNYTINRGFTRIDVFSGEGITSVDITQGTGGAGGDPDRINGENADDLTSDSIDDGGSGGNGGTRTGTAANGGGCRYDEDKDAYFEGYNGQNAAENTGNGGGGGGGGGLSGSPQNVRYKSETNDGGNGGNGADGYVIIEVDLEKYSTDYNTE